MRELAQLGTGSPLEGPLPWTRSCLVTPSPDDRSSMSSGSAKEQQGHLLREVQLLHPLVRGLGLFLPILGTGWSWRAGAAWEDACWMAAVRYSWGVERKARKGVMK